jgi:hypothetical protein
MFDVGKILKAGGNPTYDEIMFGVEPDYVVSNQRSFVIDINGGTTAGVTEIPPLKWPRTMANAVVLPNGQVLVLGGRDNGQNQTNDGPILPGEVFDPATNTWKEMAPMSIARPYHSVAVLLADGKVMVAGGGLCNTDTCLTNHPDMQIFTPPYLLGGVPRPVIMSAPQDVTVGSAFPVSTSGAVTGFSLVRMGSVTHSTDTDQRFMRLASTATGGGGYLVNAPANSNIAPPGLYLLFALNGQTPSEGHVVKVQPQ